MFKSIVLRFLLGSFLSLNIRAEENRDKEFIELYLTIQNLEKEIATLRNEIEVIQTQLDFYQEKNIQKIGIILDSYCLRNSQKNITQIF